MIDAVIHRLTNRSGDFVDPALSAAVSFVPLEEDAGSSQLRDFLKLRPGDPECHLRACLAAVYSYEEVLAEFGESKSTFSVCDLRPAAVSGEGVSLVGGFGVTPSLIYSPASYPFSGKTRIECLDSSLSIATQDAVTRNVSHSMRSNGLVQLWWPAEFGISGFLDIGGASWEPGYSVELEHDPTVYPYKLAVDEAIKLSGVIHHLSAVGLLSHFTAAQSPMEKMALLCLATAYTAIHGS